MRSMPSWARTASGKSTLAHVLMGRPGYEVTSGSVSLDGVELLGLAPFARAQAGLFLTFQYPIEVPGVPLASALTESLLAAGRNEEAEAGSLGARISQEAAELGDRAGDPRPSDERRPLRRRSQA